MIKIIKNKKIFSVMKRIIKVKINNLNKSYKKQKVLSKNQVITKKMMGSKISITITKIITTTKIKIIVIIIIVIIIMIIIIIKIKIKGIITITTDVIKITMMRTMKMIIRMTRKMTGKPIIITKTSIIIKMIGIKMINTMIEITTIIIKEVVEIIIGGIIMIRIKIITINTKIIIKNQKRKYLPLHLKKKSRKRKQTFTQICLVDYD